MERSREGREGWRVGKREEGSGGSGVESLLPQVHPQPETYWGHVNPIGPRACYDEVRAALGVCHSTS